MAGLLLVVTGAHMKGHGDVDAILHRIATAYGPALLAGVLDRSFREPLEPAYRETLLAWAGSVPQRAVLDVLTSQRDLDLTGWLSRISCPVQVVHGEFDPTRPVEAARELASAIPRARLTVLPTGHTPVYEAPAEVAGVVRRLYHR